MSEDEVESFEITEYDLEHEFSLRRGRRLTKKQQIYGVFAEDSDDEENSRPSFSGTQIPKKSYTTPVSFISAGVQQSQKKKAEEKPEDIGGSSSEEEVLVRPSFGKKKKKLGSSRFDSSGEIAGMRRGGNLGKGIGDWEKHTRGIGAKLLLQMGFQPGKGLGKTLQGRSVPVEAYKQKGRAALGLHTQSKPSITVDSEEEEEKEFKEKLNKWRRGEGKKKRVKYVYKTVEEVLESGVSRKLKPTDAGTSKVKVIDMTGPEQRVLSGYSAIHGQQPPKEEAGEDSSEKGPAPFTMPELQHNLDLIVDMSEQDIIRNDRALRHEEDRIITLRQEEETLSTILEKELKEIKILQDVVSLIEVLENKKDGQLTLEEATQTFRKLERDYYEQYQGYQLSHLAVDFVFPLVSSTLSDWSPLTEPNKHVPMFRTWKDLVETTGLDVDSRVGDKLDISDVYHKMVWDCWMPVIRSAINSWNHKNCEVLIVLLETWIPLIPNWILQNILDQLVLPRLQAAVDEWNPLTDTVPIHSWVQPWLPLMGPRLETVYPTIRMKLSTALINWHPSDRSAKLILQPWAKMFTRGSFDAFILKNIYPKLRLAMHEFTINPHEQHLDQWNWVMDWEELLPTQSLVQILKPFFEKWLQVLDAWLSHSPNYEEVSRWYVGWKRMFPERLMADPTIRDNFKRALDMMNQASGGFPSSSRDTYLTNKPVDVRRNIESLSDMIQTAVQIPQGYHQVVEKRCNERGILFREIINKYHEGNQIYRCGHLQIYFDRNVIFYLKDSIWVPVSLQNMLDMAG